MKLYVNVVIVCLIALSIRASSAKTSSSTFLGPDVHSYDQTFGYYFKAVSQDKKMARVNSDCTVDQDRFSKQMDRVYEHCGAHDFSIPPEIFHRSEVRTLPHQTQLYVYINSDSGIYVDGHYQNIMECLKYNPVMDCLTESDRRMIECLNRLTNVTLSHQSCDAPFSKLEIAGIAAASSFGFMILLAVFYCLSQEYSERSSRQSGRYNVLPVLSSEFDDRDPVEDDI